jgi:hypothetical protein
MCKLWANMALKNSWPKCEGILCIKFIKGSPVNVICTRVYGKGIAGGSRKILNE